MAKRGLITAHPGARKVYEKLGDDVANELVEWFNLVDATYRSDLRELNEFNFARFDARLEQRVAVRPTLSARYVSRASGFPGPIITRGSRSGDSRVRRTEPRVVRQPAGFSMGSGDAKLDRRLATTAGLVLGVVKLLGG